MRLKKMEMLLNALNGKGINDLNIKNKSKLTRIYDQARSNNTPRLIFFNTVPTRDLINNTPEECITTLWNLAVCRNDNFQFITIWVHTTSWTRREKSEKKTPLNQLDKRRKIPAMVPSFRRNYHLNKTLVKFKARKKTNKEIWL